LDRSDDLSEHLPALWRFRPQHVAPIGDPLFEGGAETLAIRSIALEVRVERCEPAIR